MPPSGCFCSGRHELLGPHANWLQGLISSPVSQFHLEQLLSPGVFDCTVVCVSVNKDAARDRPWTPGMGGLAELRAHPWTLNARSFGSLPCRPVLVRATPTYLRTASRRAVRSWRIGFIFKGKVLENPKSGTKLNLQALASKAYVFDSPLS